MHTHAHKHTRTNTHTYTHTLSLSLSSLPLVCICVCMCIHHQRATSADVCSLPVQVLTALLPCWQPQRQCRLVQGRRYALECPSVSCGECWTRQQHFQCTFQRLEPLPLRLSRRRSGCSAHSWQQPRCAALRPPTAPICVITMMMTHHLPLPAVNQW
jgi:hypothetical protein